LIKEADNICERAALPMLMEKICAAYDLRSVAYFGLNVAKEARGEPYLAVTYSHEWVQHYRVENYVSIDPVIRDGFAALLPMEWNGDTAQSKKLRTFFGEAGEFGLGRLGLTFPIRGRAGDRALFTITSDVSPKEWRAQRLWLERDLQMLAFHLHQRVLVIEGMDFPPVKLAPREIECLRWVLEEKTHWEISVILGISVKTVNFYLENARFKLGAATSWHAALKASHQNMLF
jgi:DNA-binding CsgD family transcriptional regulator